MKASGIYAIRNLINGKRYVGSAVYLTGRFCDHKKRLRHRRHHSIKMQRSWDKHGEANFVFEVLEVVEDKTQLTAREQVWIEFYNAACPRRGYNVSPTAGNCLGVKHSEETRAKISAVQRGRKQPPETVAKRAASLRGHRPWNLGRVSSQETRAKISAATKGRKLSPAHCEKLSAFRTGMKYSDQMREKCRARMTGQKATVETRAKMAESSRLAWARRKAQGVSIGPV